MGYEICKCEELLNKIDDLRNLVEELIMENADLRSQIDYLNGLNLENI